jgi:serine/threonine-protein kinase
MQAAETEPQSSESLQPGDALGRYQLLCPIARGGMGQVWAARQAGRLGLPKLVAIKIAIPLESSSYRQVQEYLFDEAQVAASVDHPNVCKILELGHERGMLFIAMEWLNGAPLSTLVSKLPQRRLDYRMAAYLVAQACSGLHAAHELTDDDGVHMEVVHRDATPHNFLITAAGELKVMDFGIVKSKNQQHQATQTGELKGKISYLAPEQIRGHEVDRRADIFALGCVLYAITVGKGAFNPDTGQDAGRTILRILDGDYTKPSALLPDYPAELEAIVTRALAIKPDQRFQTAEELRQALEAFLGDGSRAVTREDVAALLHQYCGPAVEQRRAEIRGAQKLFDSQSGQRSGTFPAAEKAFEVDAPAASSATFSRTLAAAGVSVSVGTGTSMGMSTGTGTGSNSALDWALRSTPVPPPSAVAKRSTSVVWGVLGGFALFAVASAATTFLIRRSASTETTPQTGLLQPTPHASLPGATSDARASASATGPAAQPSAEASESAAASTARPELSTRSPRRSSAPRTGAKVTAASPSPGTAAGSEASAPDTSPQFSQTVSRKPPRHAIDESDPFGK